MQSSSTETRGVRHNRTNMEETMKEATTSRSEDEENLVSVYDVPTLILRSQYGTTTYLEWCKLEVERINRSVSNKGSARLRWKEGLVAVTR